MGGGTPPVCPSLYTATCWPTQSTPSKLKGRGKFLIQEKASVRAETSRKVPVAKEQSQSSAWTNQISLDGPQWHQSSQGLGNEHKWRFLTWVISKRGQAFARMRYYTQRWYVPGSSTVQGTRDVKTITLPRLLPPTNKAQSDRRHRLPEGSLKVSWAPQQGNCSMQ